MHCKYCGFANGDDDHRCLRCGRRLSGVVIAAPPGYSGANALAAAVLERAQKNETGEFTAAELAPEAPQTSAQTPLFASNTQKVIPFDQIQRQATAKLSLPPQLPTQKHVGAPRSPARKPAPPIEQGTLDFIPAAPARTRKLKTDVDAQVFCDQPVATPTHRLVAAAIDAAMIVIAFGVLVVIFQALGGSFGKGKLFWMGLGAAFALVSLFYSLVWAIAGRETAGMRSTDLRLITFDGFPLDGRTRALRVAATWLSYCSGLGILWALADEENLTWHDHISKTFPTVREIPRTFVKQRR